MAKMKEKMKTLILRMRWEDWYLVKSISGVNGEPVCAFIRKAVREKLVKLGYLNKDELKAMKDCDTLTLAGDY
jgi:predicted transcriptional regulator